MTGDPIIDRLARLAEQQNGRDRAAPHEDKSPAHGVELTRRESDLIIRKANLARRESNLAAEKADLVQRESAVARREVDSKSVQRETVQSALALRSALTESGDQMAKLVRTAFLANLRARHARKAAIAAVLIAIIAALAALVSIWPHIQTP